MMEKLNNIGNYGLLNADLQSLKHLIKVRRAVLQSADVMAEPSTFQNPAKYGDDNYAALLNQYRLSLQERIVLILGLASYLAPEVLDDLFVINEKTGTNFTELGGKTSQSTSAFLPTGETAVFLCAGDSLQHRIIYQKIFDQNEVLYRANLLKLQGVEEGETPLSGRIIPTDECLHFIINGTDYVPTYTSNFPASKVETKLTWDDLVLSFNTHDMLNELDAWLAHKMELVDMPMVSRKFKRGYRALFHGPSGTGKTLTASLLAKKYERSVYQIDLSMVVSKYIGETEKNLKNIFDVAENKEWILFFDEADALFGKRTSTQSSNDRYANQEVSYLLQRIEDYPGLIILASNLKTNMDKAFLRRFQSIIYFPIPDAEQRYELWQKAFSSEIGLDKSVDLKKIAKTHELTGAAIGNILRYCTLMALQKGERMVDGADLQEGIKRELVKEGKTA